MSYNIIINEYQRKLIQQALDHLKTSQPSLLKSQPADDSVALTEESAYGECEVLSDMIKDLPRIEGDDPGTIHGLCI